VHLSSCGTYGSPRVHAELTLGLGITVGHGAVEMLMRRARIKGLPGNRCPRPKHKA
jgi:putative transposase